MNPHKKLEEIKDFIFNNYKYQDGKILIIHHSHKYKENKLLKGHVTKQGYVHVSIKNQTFKEHRVIFLLVNGYIPKFIDHIDGNKSNNKIENLRECSISTNMANVGLIRPTRKEKFKGYNRVKRLKSTYQARIRFNGKFIHIGMFKSEEEAARAYDEKARELFGEFACTNFN